MNKMSSDIANNTNITYAIHFIGPHTIELPHANISRSSNEGRNDSPEREGKLNTSDLAAFLHMIKSSLGTGLLAMPYAFSNSGIVVGTIGVIMVAVISVLSSKMLVKSSQQLCQMQGKISMTYAETVESAFRIGAGGRFGKWSRLMRNISDFISFITYFGTNTVYVIIIASTFKQVLESHLVHNINIRWCILMVTVPLVPIGILRHMKLLVPLSALANLLLLVGCLLTLYYCFIDMPPLSSRPLVVSPTKWPFFVCTTLFGMEGIGTVLPIENAMRYPSHFLGRCGVLNISMAVVGGMFFVMGFFGYLRYGADVQGVITLNLPQNALCEAVKSSVALAILLTYPLQLTVSIEVVWQRVKWRFSEGKQEFGYYLSRALIILGTVAIAAIVPDLSPVISLVGAIGFSGLGLLLPTVTELVTFWDSLGSALLVKHLLFLLVWVVATVSGTITSFQQLVAQF